HGPWRTSLKATTSTRSNSWQRPDCGSSRSQPPSSSRPTPAGLVLRVLFALHTPIPAHLLILSFAAAVVVLLSTAILPDPFPQE
ncbi:hypothetical protein FIBSPDRAFT_1043206, partial [Athelia psychrophila]